MTTSEPPAWDEAQCTAALAQLERLQAQIDDARLTIPRVIQPFYSPPTPSMFAAFKENLTTSQNDMKNFRNQWKSPEIQKILAHSKQSFDANQDVSRSIEVLKYGWEVMEEEGREEVQNEEQDKGPEIDQGVDLSQEDIKKIVEEWRSRNSKIRFQAQDDYRDFKIWLIANSRTLKFHVSITPDSDGLQKLRAVCLGAEEPAPAITRCLNTRPHNNDLKYLLDMIAAYKKTGSTPCARCGKIYDSQISEPVARRSREVSRDDGTDLEWDAFHERCMDQT